MATETTVVARTSAKRISTTVKPQSPPARSVTSDSIRVRAPGAGRGVPGDTGRGLLYRSPAFSALSTLTVTIGLSFKKLFSPIPFTFINSSIFLNPPFFWRWSTMA